MKLNFIQIASIIAIFQSFFIAVQLWLHGKNGSTKNRILSLYMFLLGLLIFSALTVTSGVEQYFLPFHKMIFLFNQTGFLLGPLLYYYIKINSSGNIKLGVKDLLHILPFLFFTVYFALCIISLQHFVLWAFKPRMLNTVLLLIHNLVYFIVALRLLKRNYKAKSVTVRVMWLLLVSFIVFWSVQLNTFILLNLFGYYKYCPHMTSLYSICAFLFINLIAYFASQKSEFYNQLKKYETSTLDESGVQYFKAKLLKVMSEDKPYLNPSLGLEDLAKIISIPHRQLSQVINASFNKSFYDFINSYRIAECRKIFDANSNDRKTIIEIAYEVGFNTKSAFNKAFKKHTGIAPKEYKNGTQRSMRSNLSK